MILPKNKKFAFSIFDDTDKSTFDNINPVYKLLSELKIYTTKSVWVSSSSKTEIEANKGQTLNDSDYLAFILDLRNKGFEIGFHGAKGGDSTREETIEAIEKFKQLIGYYPKTYANHLNNKENLYWGAARLNYLFLKILYKLATINKKYIFMGHIPSSEYFWGDIAKKYITYVRNFTFPEINTSEINPSMPYYDPRKPYINFWFSSSDGHNVETFNKLLSEKNMDKLENEGGVCIIYTHFANDFVKNGEVNPETKRLLINLSKKDGWFVPVGTLLDFLREQHKSNIISKSEKIKMEYKWFLNKIIHGTS